MSIPLSVRVPVCSVIDNVGQVSYYTLSYAETNTRNLIVNGIEQVTDNVGKTLWNAVREAENYVGQKLPRDLIIDSEMEYHMVNGNSWELMMAVGVSCLLSRVPLKAEVTGTGFFAKSLVSPVGNTFAKICAAKRRGFRRFIMSEWQNKLESGAEEGIEVRRVSTLEQAFVAATGMYLLKAVPKSQ